MTPLFRPISASVSGTVKFLDWDAVFRLGHSPTQAVHGMSCIAWKGECPNLKTASQSRNLTALKITAIQHELNRVYSINENSKLSKGH